jgi:Patatin-like phospholipase/Vacuolar protein sorting-associated protein 62
VNGEAATFGLRRDSMLCLSGGGYRAALFHLGALTRLNELGLLAGVETIYGVGGGSILGALLAARIPWPLQGAFRDWPEAIAEPMREISRRHGRGRTLRRSSPSSGSGEEERYARELAGLPEGRAPGGPRCVFGAAGLALGQTASAGAGERDGELRWELERPPPPLRIAPDPIGTAIGSIRDDLVPLGEAERAVLENRGYLFADAALRAGRGQVAAIEPLPPEPPHPRWASEHRLREELLGRRRRRLDRLPRLPRRRQAAGHGSRRRAELLGRFRPFVQHDSLEAYRPDSVATIVELAIGPRCNTLHRAGGELIASVLPVEGAARLDLDYLDDALYGDGRPVRGDDYLDETGGSHAADALAMRRDNGLDDVVYGQTRRSGGRLWLQYWFFYYYNDKGFLKVGRHEGDWETIQLRIGADGEPDAVTYGRHACGERADWDEVERQRTDDGEAPVVYCARGSHASLLRGGTHSAPAVPDHNDGLGPRLRPRLVALGDDLPGWARWPGRWGSTRRRETFEGDSPRGPAQDRRWQSPAEFHHEARPAAETPRWKAPAPATPRLEARLEGDHALLSYRFPDRRSGEASPARIVATAVAADGASLGTVDCFLVEGGVGSCALPVPGGGAVTGVRAAVASELGTPGLTLTVPIV